MKKASFLIRFTIPARKELKRLTEPQQTLIAKKIRNLASEPLPDSVVKLKGVASLYRIRSGDYRIVYQIHNEELIVLIIKIGHRRDVYKIIN